MQGAFRIPLEFDTGTNKVVMGDGDDYEPFSLPTYTGADASIVTAVSDPLTGGSTFLVDGVLSDSYTRPKARVAFVGDSITAGSGPNGYGIGRTYGFGDSPATHAMLSSDGRWDLVLSAGVGGQTSEQIAARIQSEIIPAGVSICVIQSCFWNDIGLGLTPAQNLVNVKRMVSDLVAANIRPVLVLPTPDARTGSTAPRLTAAAQMTANIRALGASNGIPLVDPRPAVIDPATGTLATTFNADGSVHPNPAGYQQLGISVKSVLDTICQPCSADLVCHALDSTDLLSGKGMFLSSSGGVGAGWSYNSASGVVPTVTTDSGVLGNMQTLTSTAGGSAYSDIPVTGWQVGDVLELRGIFSGSGGTAAPRLRFVVGGAPVPNTYPTIEPKAAITRGKFRCAWQVPAGATAIWLRMQVQGGTGVFSIGQVSVRNLTALGLA